MSTSPARCCHSGLVRLATLNVFGLSGNWSDRLVVLRNGFLALDAELVTLQETMVREEVDQAAEILGPGFQLAQRQPPGGERLRYHYGHQVAVGPRCGG